MTREQALKQVIADGGLKTATCKPLGIPFEAFLRMAQWPKEEITQFQTDMVRWAKNELKKERLGHNV